ncbi:MAG TPA: hypothetical protein PKY82_35640 [Pyrinomonadaceae bacterium]|nr:hypothetical protein [Pyrinomonadaceae bacterium]
MKNTLFAVIIIVLTTVLLFSQTSKPRFVHEPDLRTLLPKFLTAQGFLDPKYSEATAKPSRYYSDFYGIQALGVTTKEGIKRDFVPKFAEVIAEDENSVTLKFKDGFTGKFYPNSLLKAAGVEVKWDHVEISGDKWTDLRDNLDKFIKLLETNKLAKKYLRTNPHYQDELVVFKQLSKKNQLVPKIANFSEMQGEKNSLLLFPEGVHGNLKGYEKFKTEVLDKEKFDWIGMEMLTPSMQKDLDIFINAAENSAEHRRTRKILLDYFKDSWNGRSGPKTTAEENYYFKIVEQMRKQKTRVIGIEKSTIEYIFFRFGENKFGAAVRSYWWAKALPKTGKGLIFGGSAHFTDKDAINFQDFEAMLNPKMKMFVLEALKIRN